jgi:hypothetical protein
LDENEEIGVEMSFCETWELGQWDSERGEAGLKQEAKMVSKDGRA